jgi:DNA-binding CsgD family transcriptional regulator
MASEDAGVKSQGNGLEHHVDRIYRAALAPEQWPEFLEGLRCHLRLASVSLVFRHPGEDDRGIITSVGADEHYGDTYRSHYYKLNPWLPWGQVAQEGRAVLADSVLPQSELRRTEFYNDWLRPQGLAHLFTTFLCHPGQREPVAELGGLRAEGAGPLQDEDLVPVRMLVPHLQRALAIHSRVQGAEMRAGAAEEALDRIAGGVILLDERGAAIATNLTADRILVMEDGLVMDRDGPSASTSKQTGELRRAVAGAAKTGASQGEDVGAVMRLERPSGRQALEVVVTPIRCESSPLFDRRAAAAIFVAEPDSQLDRPPERLCQLYGFTPLEAEVASRMVKGMDVADISGDLGITIHTVRGHLKRLFAKTGTHRQPDLIRVLLTGLAGLRLE